MKYAGKRQGPSSELTTLDGDICAIVVIEAELCCQPADSQHRHTLTRQRDRLFAGMSEGQIAQLDRIASSLHNLVATINRVSQAA